MFDFSQSRIGGYPTEGVQSVPIDYATGGYGPGDVARIQREQLQREGREQASFLAYLNAVAQGAPAEQLAQINPMQHYMQTGQRFMPVEDEMMEVGTGQFNIPGIVERSGLRQEAKTKALKNASAGLDLQGQQTARAGTEVWKKTPLQQALESMNPGDAMLAALLSAGVPQFYGDTGIPSKYQHELDIEEKKGEKVKEATKLGWGKLLETGNYHKGVLENAGERTDLMGGKNANDFTTRLMQILQTGAGNPLDPNAATQGSELMQLIAEALEQRRSASAEGGPRPVQPGGDKQVVQQLTKQLNSQHSSATVGSTTTADVGGQTLHFVKTRTGWKVAQ